MKLKLFRVNTRTVANWYEQLYVYCLGTDIETVANRVGVPPQDVRELDNEVVVNISAVDINNNPYGGRN